MILGIAIGIFFMVCLVLAFMAGYGMSEQKHTSDNENK